MASHRAFPADRMVLVYALSSTKDGEIRYIGQTTKDIKTRLSWHKTNSRHSKQPVTKWVRSQLEAGFDVVATVLCADAVLHETERELIAKYRADGYRLLNLTDGGDGVRGYRLTEDHKRKLAEACSNRELTPELSEKRSAAKRRMWEEKTPEERHAIGLKSGEKLRGRKLSDETRRRMSEAHKRRNANNQRIADGMAA